MSGSDFGDSFWVFFWDYLDLNQTGYCRFFPPKGLRGLFSLPLLIKTRQVRLLKELLLQKKLLERERVTFSQSQRSDWTWWLHKTMWPPCGRDKTVQQALIHVCFSTDTSEDKRIKYRDMSFINFIRGQFSPIRSVVRQLSFSRWTTAVVGLK